MSNLADMNPGDLDGWAVWGCESCKVVCPLVLIDDVRREKFEMTANHFVAILTFIEEHQLHGAFKKWRIIDGDFCEEVSN